jgi:hypothetical protein
MSAPQIPHHPVLAALTANSRSGSPQPESITKLSGYVGPASQEGLVRLYTALDDLSHYLEFDGNAVVQTTETPDTEMSHNARTLWVKASTPVRWIREYPSAHTLVSSVARGMSQAGIPGARTPRLR